MAHSYGPDIWPVFKRLYDISFHQRKYNEDLRNAEDDGTVRLALSKVIFEDMDSSL
jgi:hypothetical protein